MYQDFEAVAQRCSVVKAIPRNFAKFTGKHLCQSLFFNKVAGLRPEACHFIKKGTLARVFSCEFYETSKNSFFYRIPLVAASEDYFLWRGFESVRAQWTNCFNIFMIKISCLYEKKSSHRRCSVRKDVLRNFTKFTGNTCARVSGCNFFTEHLFYRTPLEECF